MLITVLVALAAAPVVVPSPTQTGILTPPLVGSPDQAALRFVQSRATELGLDPRTTLTVTGNFSTRFGGTIHLTQSVNGLLVSGRKVIVTFDTMMRVVRVSSTLSPLGAFKLDATVSPTDAMELASREIEGAWRQRGGAPYGGTKKLLAVVRGELHVAYLVFVPTLKNSESWHVLVDATDGEVLGTQNRAWSNNAAAVYATSPLAQGVGVTQTTNVMLTGLPADGGFLTGTRVRTLNCCPTIGCAVGAGQARATGTTQTFQGPVDFDVAICDQRQLATNDPALHASGDYVYAPVDPPTSPAYALSNLADWDAFAEVHAYHHATKTDEAMVRLSQGPVARDGGFTPFRMRDTGPGGGLPTAWVNVVDPDFDNAMDNGMGVFTSNTFTRTDNAMFLARENMDFLLLPPQVINSDALVMYQGESADFAYDGPVLWHEYGHGVINSTSNWDVFVTIDRRSANNESSALNEGVADLIAMMTGKRSIVGEYVGPRISPGETNIRDVNNTKRCPNDTWGQQHNDSQYFTGAIWEARQQFLGTDDGDTFDAALYAAIVSFPPDVNFESAARIISDALGQAFPNVADASMRMRAIFDARGVTNCSKVFDITDSLATPREYFGMPGTSFAGVQDNGNVPGPYQVKIRLPRGARSVSFSAQMASFGNNPRLELLAAIDRPIGFAVNAGSIANDATLSATATLSQGTVSATLPIDVPCGSEVTLALANNSRRDRTLIDLRFAYEEALSCPDVPDAGPVGGGGGGTGGGSGGPVRLVAPSETLGPTVMGCGCSGGPSLLFVAAAGLLFARRRRR